MARQLLPATDHFHLPKVQLSAPRLLAETHRPYREYGLRPGNSLSGMIPSQRLHLGEALFIQWGSLSSKTKIIHMTLHFNGSIHLFPTVRSQSRPFKLIAAGMVGGKIWRNPHTIMNLTRVLKPMKFKSITTWAISSRYFGPVALKHGSSPRNYLKLGTCFFIGWAWHFELGKRRERRYRDLDWLSCIMLES